MQHMNVQMIYPMKELFLIDGNENALVDRTRDGDTDDSGFDKIIGEIIKIVQFALLREKVQELIPKFDLAKKIGGKRLMY